MGKIGCDTANDPLFANAFTAIKTLASQYSSYHSIVCDVKTISKFNIKFSKVRVSYKELQYEN